MPEVTVMTAMGCEYKSGILEDEVKVLLLEAMYVQLGGKKDNDKGWFCER